MANTYTQLYIHMVFSTKRRIPFIRKEDYPRLHQYIMTVLDSKQCPGVVVGGVEDHVHLLFQLGKCVSIADVARYVKTSSSKWIKELDACYEGFAWQDGYAAFSVSKAVADKVKTYILNQEQHHKGEMFENEIRSFLEQQGIAFDEQYLFD